VEREEQLSGVREERRNGYREEEGGSLKKEEWIRKEGEKGEGRKLEEEAEASMEGGRK